MVDQNFEQKSLANLLVVRNLTERLGGGIKKSFGQNFLVNQKNLFRFIDSLNITKEDTVIEIGPGIGVVSYTLCERAKKVILIELDRDKEEALKKVLENFDNYELIFADGAEFDYSNLKNIGEVKVIGSLPYNVGKRIIYKILNSDFNWTKAAFILQKEVAENYTSKQPKADFLSVFASIYAKAEMRFQISPKSFYPIPKVDSSVIVFEKINDGEDLTEKAKLSKFIKHGFSAPRKTVLNNLKNLGFKLEDFEKTRIKITARPSELSLEEWRKLFEVS